MLKHTLRAAAVLALVAAVAAPVAVAAPEPAPAPEPVLAASSLQGTPPPAAPGGSAPRDRLA
ncbi:hypothetical protein ACIGO8_19155 [Streptomyces sp. NPDC053493]|uniref:hypothetical protein n=1 Tax=Streptomyces sp. NPDC053493 TaxID=3365705 RepID=UPI0037D0F088